MTSSNMIRNTSGMNNRFILQAKDLPHYNLSQPFRLVYSGSGAVHLLWALPIVMLCKAFSLLYRVTLPVYCILSQTASLIHYSRQPQTESLPQHNLGRRPKPLQAESLPHHSTDTGQCPNPSISSKILNTTS